MIHKERKREREKSEQMYLYKVRTLFALRAAAAGELMIFFHREYTLFS